MIDPAFLAMLACPSTRQPLRLCTAAELAAVNRAIQAGTAKNRGGQPVGEPLQGGLVTQDGAALYPIRDDFPILLTPEAIPLR